MAHWDRTRGQNILCPASVRFHHTGFKQRATDLSALKKKKKRWSGIIPKGHLQFQDRNYLFPQCNKHLSDPFIGLIRPDSLVKSFCLAVWGHDSYRSEKFHWPGSVFMKAWREERVRETAIRRKARTAGLLLVLLLMWNECNGWPGHIHCVPINIASPDACVPVCASQMVSPYSAFHLAVELFEWKLLQIMASF